MFREKPHANAKEDIRQASSQAHQGQLSAAAEAPECAALAPVQIEQGVPADVFASADEAKTTALCKTRLTRTRR